METKKIRLKKYIYILDQGKNFNLVTSYGQGTIMRKNDFSKMLIDLLKNGCSKEELIESFSVSTELIEKMLVKLFNENIIEYYEDSSSNQSHSYRYSRQLMFFDLLKPQSNVKDTLCNFQSLKEKHIVVLGVGGIGNYGSLSFVSMGVEKITLIDGDEIEDSNLNRQILFSEKSLGEKKVDIAKKRLLELNSQADIATICESPMDADSFVKVLDTVEQPDFIFLSADSPFGLASWVEKYCKQHEIPFMRVGYVGLKGVVSQIIDGDSYSNDESKLFYEDGNEYVKDELIKKWNTTFTPPSFGATNAIISNVAVMEVAKYYLLGKEFCNGEIVIDLVNYKIKQNEKAVASR